MENYDDFFQEGPELQNQFNDDALLLSYLKRVLPEDMLKQITPDLERLGDRVVKDIYDMGIDAELNEPYLKQFDVWGKKINEVVVSDGWQELEEVSAEEGLVAIGYERKYGDLSRVYQFAKLYLFTPSSAVFTCPLAMSDGAIRLIEVYGDQELKSIAIKNLTSRDPSEFWTSTQQMTERTGGSDVARALTIAEKTDIEGEYKLFGHKWFVSAVTAQMGMTLAKIRQEDGNIIPGSRGLSLFYLKMRNKDGTYNNIEIEALKDKLGTRALPTAQLSLNGSLAKLVGEEGNGIKKIATLFNVTRIYNALSAVSFMRRAIALSLDYAKKREAFKELIINHPLHIQSLARMQTEFEGAFQLTFFEVALMGKVECGTATTNEKVLLRLLTPIAKLYTAKQSIEVVSEYLEMLGGIGYLEDTGFPKLLRDTQVLSIWEGTTNVLSLDMLRAIEKDQAYYPLIETIDDKLKQITLPELIQDKGKVSDAFEKLQLFFKQAFAIGKEYLNLSSRDLSYSIARIMISVLLLEHAQWCHINNTYPNSLAVAHEWCKKNLSVFEIIEDVDIDHFKSIIQ
ncbi:MAG: putative acyl-CoA dehydrogenase AidB [Candidatus Heimdallarchaeota archaeon LC_3]|nr:MAG: putative acyl-CoA dehydrogenase AidB [Candidatus Heimdallarchaeota archaeon LC_3]